MSRDYVRFPLHYRALNGLPAVCEISIFATSTIITVVVTDEDVGPSVTNNIEAIVKVLDERHIPYDFLVQHARGERVKADQKLKWDSESWEFVSFDFERGKPHWVHAIRQHIEDLIGMPYPD